MVPPTPLEVDIFGGVGQQREPVECAQHEHLLLERMLCQGGTDLVDGAVAGPTTVHRDLTDPLDEVEGWLSVGGSDRIAEEATEQSNVIADGVSGHGDSQAVPKPEGNQCSTVTSRQTVGHARRLRHC